MTGGYHNAARKFFILYIDANSGRRTRPVGKHHFYAICGKNTRHCFGVFGGEKTRIIPHDQFLFPVYRLFARFDKIRDRLCDYLHILKSKLITYYRSPSIRSEFDPCHRSS